jgi:hypothetical protein
MSLYDAQMAEVAKADEIIADLSEQIKACRATRSGYRKASELRANLAMWKDMRKRMLDYAAIVSSAQAGVTERRDPKGLGERSE